VLSQHCYRASNRWQHESLSSAASTQQLDKIFAVDAFIICENHNVFVEFQLNLVANF